MIGTPSAYTKTLMRALEPQKRKGIQRSTARKALVRPYFLFMQYCEKLINEEIITAFTRYLNPYASCFNLF